MFENMVLRKIFGTKGYEVTEDWRKLQREELHRRMRWSRHVA
jgi:hypothetical protein